MAARLNPRHDARVREKIKTSQLVNRLNSFALGEKEKSGDKLVEMTTQQVNAAKILLSKVIPDLKAVEMSGSIATTKNPADMTDAELAAIATEGSATPLKT